MWRDKCLLHIHCCRDELVPKRFISSYHSHRKAMSPYCCNLQQHLGVTLRSVRTSFTRHSLSSNQDTLTKRWQSSVPFETRHVACDDRRLEGRPLRFCNKQSLYYRHCHQAYNNRQQRRWWNETTKNPEYIDPIELYQEEEKDELDLRLEEIQKNPGELQTIWVSLMIDGKLVGGTQIDIPKVNANIDMIKYAVKEKCSDVLTGIAPITFQVWPTQYKRKKSKRKLTRKNRILKADVIYDMVQHGGESEIAGIIVKAYKKRMQDATDHYSYGMKDAIDNGIAFVDAIMKPYKDIVDTDGMRVLYDVPDLESGTTKDIILRNNITEPFWNQVYELSNTLDDEKYRICVVGTSGIGKTTTTAILIRILLENEKTVVYHIRTQEKSRWVYEFIPNKNLENPYGVDVKVKSDKEFNAALTPSLVDDPANYYIVDAGVMNGNCNPDDQLQARVILITSTNKQQWGGDNFLQCRGNATSGTFLYYPIWTLNELLDVYSFIRTNETEEKVIERYHQVGGVPGHIFALPQTYYHVVENQTVGIECLTTQQLKFITVNNWKAVSDRIFEKTNSLQMSITGYANGTSDNKFIKPNVIPLSTNIFTKICLYHEKWFWKYFVDNGFRNDDNCAFARKFLAILCRDAMLKESSYTPICKDLLALTSEANDNCIYVSLGGCMEMQLRDGDIVSAATQTENVIFYSSAHNIVDFIYRKNDIYYVFHVTLDRSCHIPGLEEIVKLAHSTGIDSPEQMHFYYVVPSIHFDEFAINNDQLENEDELLQYTRYKVRVLGLDRDEKNDITKTFLS